EAIEVAAPVLRYSPRLTDEDLLACAGSQARMFAIAQRATLSERVGDTLVEGGNQEVVRSVAQNAGERFSEAGYGRLVERALDDEELAVSVGLRKDIPASHLRTLVSKASEAAFQRLAAGNPAVTGELGQVLFDLTGRRPGADGA